VHLFPEGRVWQEDGTPLRTEDGRWCHNNGRCSEPNSRVGPFKWGLARALCESDTEAELVPIYHQGMDKVLPQNRNNDVIVYVPHAGSVLDVAIGGPVEYLDLVRGFETRRDARSMRRLLRNIDTIAKASG